jgi:hypothetical protein
MIPSLNFFARVKNWLVMEARRCRWRDKAKNANVQALAAL